MERYRRSLKRRKNYNGDGIENEEADTGTNGVSKLIRLKALMPILMLTLATLMTTKTLLLQQLVHRRLRPYLRLPLPQSRRVRQEAVR